MARLMEEINSGNGEGDKDENGKMPPKKFQQPNPVTQFDTTRRDTLGVKLRGLEEIIADTLGFLKNKGALPE